MEARDAVLYTQMVETDYIPLEATRYYILPLDKVGRDRTLCRNKRPISLLSAFMQLSESLLVRHVKMAIEPMVTDSEYA